MSTNLIVDGKTIQLSPEWVILAGLDASGMPQTFRLSKNGGLKVTAVPFKGTASFNRPGDTNAYAQFDAITNSTSAPVPMELAIAGLEAGDFLDIRNVRVNTGTKPTGTRLLANVFLSKTTFTATNDNAELSIDDATAEGGVWVPCVNQFQTALNYRVSSDPSAHMMQAAGSSIFATIQANNAWAPGNADLIRLVVEGYIVKA